MPGKLCVINVTVEISSITSCFTPTVAVTVAVGAGVKTTVVATAGMTLKINGLIIAVHYMSTLLN
jgi:hypothetical protein